MTLRDCVAIVTGASSGIGAATAVAFGREGMCLALFARRVDRLEETANAVRAAGGQAIVAPGDVRDRAALANLVEQTLAAYGRIDVLFNNAGLGRLGWLESIDPADVDLTLDVNLRGAIDAARSVLPPMIAQRSGHIINMASLAGQIGAPTYSVYAATKFGLAGFSEALRREVAVWGVRVSAVYPAGVPTAWGEEAGYRRHGRWSTPRFARLSVEDVARSIVELVKRPRREVILPPVARLAVWANRAAPWLVDWLAKRFVISERREDLRRA